MHGVRRSDAAAIKSTARRLPSDEQVKFLVEHMAAADLQPKVEYDKLSEKTQGLIADKPTGQEHTVRR